jgi:hypothetical protein
MKLDKQTGENMLSSLKSKTGSVAPFSKMAAAAILKKMQCRRSAIYSPIVMKFGTQTKKNMLSPKNAKLEV